MFTSTEKSELPKIDTLIDTVATMDAELGT